MEKLQNLFLKDASLSNPGAIDFYRIIFGISSLVFSINTFDQFYLLFSANSSPVVCFFQGLILLWIAFSVHFILFVPSRLWLVIQFFVLAILMSYQQGVFNVEGKYMIFGTFLNLFLPLNSRRETDKIDKGFIAIVLVVMTAYLFYGGFITKSLDEKWANGSGLYFVLILPWIKYPFLDILLHNKYLLMGMNYCVMIVELFAFPFAVFEKTRPIGIFLAWCFCLFLFFLLQISTIGFSALAFGVLFLSIFPHKITFLQKRGLSLDVKFIQKIGIFKPLVTLSEGLDRQMFRIKRACMIGLVIFVLSIMIRETDDAFFKIGSNQKFAILINSTK